MIAVIVYAVDDVSAMREGRRVLSGLCGDGKGYDWIRTFDDADAAQMQGWGNRPAVLRVTSEKGAELMNSLFGEMKKELLHDLKVVREKLPKYTDEEIIEEKDEETPYGKSIRRHFGTLSSIGSPYVTLYDNDGEGIATTEHLNNVLTKWEVLWEKDPEILTKYEGKDVWIVPADAHF